MSHWSAARRGDRCALRVESLETRSLLALSPLGAAFPVSGEPGGTEPEVAADADGNFVVVWEENVSEDDSDVFAQRFDRDGTKVGDAFLVHESTAGMQSEPDVAMTSDGRFVVVWRSVVFDSEATIDNVVARVFGSDGAPATDEIIVNPEPISADFVNPTVDINSIGEFIVGWSITGSASQDPNALFAQRFGADGVAEGDPILVDDDSDTSPGGPHNPSIAVFGDGSFVLGWRNGGFLASVQRFGADGEVDGPVITPVNREGLRLSGDDAGTFVVVTDSLVSLDAQLYDTTGAQVGEVINVADGGDVGSTFIGLRIHDVYMDDTGRFAVAWERVTELPTATEDTAVVRAFAANGAPEGDEVEVAEVEEQVQYNALAPAVAVLDQGRLVAAFQSVEDAGPGVLARLVDESGEPEPEPEPEPVPDDGEFDADYVADLYDSILGRPGSEAEINSWLNTPGVTPQATVLGFLNSPEYFQKLVKQFYRDFLGREADAGGLSYWTNALVSGKDEPFVASNIIASQEYFELQGGTNQGFVAALYNDLLGRGASQVEIDGWLETIAKGASRSAVALGFLTSREFRGLLVSDPDDDLSFAGWYQDYFGRDAESAGRDYWIDQLARDKAKWRDVQRNLLLSEEFFVG